MAQIAVPAPIEDIIKDKNVLAIKRKIMDRLKLSSFLNSLAETTKFIAGPLFGVGIGAIMTSQVFPMLGVVLLAAATASLLTGVIAGYASSRIYTSSQFDNLETNAQSTAHHLVEELKANNLCLNENKEHAQNCRTDGKAWAQVVDASRAQQAAQIN